MRMKKLLSATVLALVISLLALPVWAAFPAVPNENGSTSSGTSHTVNLPANIVNGNLLVAFFAVNGQPTVTFPAGWTKVYEDFHTVGGAGSVTTSCYFRRADGTEGASITVTTDSSQRAAHTTYRITGHHTTTDPEAPTAAGDIPEGDSTIPDPPSFSPSWGAEDTLWFVVEVSLSSGTDAAVSAYPTSYTDGRNDIRNNGPSQGTARRELNASSDNPGTFTIGASHKWVANTVAVRPAGVAGAPRRHATIY